MYFFSFFFLKNSVLAAAPDRLSIMVRLLSLHFLIIILTPTFSFTIKFTIKTFLLHLPVINVPHLYDIVFFSFVFICNLFGLHINLLYFIYVFHYHYLYLPVLAAAPDNPFHNLLFSTRKYFPLFFVEYKSFLTYPTFTKFSILLLEYILAATLLYVIYVYQCSAFVVFFRTHLIFLFIKFLVVIISLNLLSSLQLQTGYRAPHSHTYHLHIFCFHLL